MHRVVGPSGSVRRHRVLRRMLRRVLRTVLDGTEDSAFCFKTRFSDLRGVDCLVIVDTDQQEGPERLRPSTQHT